METSTNINGLEQQLFIWILDEIDETNDEVVENKFGDTNYENNWNIEKNMLNS